MYQPRWLKNHFLIAMPTMDDPFFEQTVVYILDHNEEGAWGMVINQTMDISWDELFKHFEIEPGTIATVGDEMVLRGGPVAPDQGFIIYTRETPVQGFINPLAKVLFSSSKNMLTKIAQGNRPGCAQIILGYSFWDRGQLERELKENVWLTSKPDANVIFTIDAASRWLSAGKLLGVNLNLITCEAGHG